MSEIKSLILCIAVGITIAAFLVYIIPAEDDNLVPGVGMVEQQRAVHSYALNTTLMFHGKEREITDQFYRMVKKANDNNANMSLRLNGDGGELKYLTMVLGELGKLNGKLHCDVTNRAISAHAFLLVNCDEVRLSKNSYVLFHHVSIYNELKRMCETSLPLTDRGVPFKDKCIEEGKFIISQVDKLLEDSVYPLLKADEIKALKAGHDVYINGADFEVRFYKNKEKL